MSKGAHRAVRRTPIWLATLIALCALAGVTLLTYPTAASWLSTYNQSLIVVDYARDVANADPDPHAQLEAAHAYNAELSSGAMLAANANVPTGSGNLANDAYDYWKMLDTENQVMSRLRIPKINLDLPIYHGTSDETLLKGAGHLQGTSLPVGGVDTHAVITAHRGLAQAEMFTNLDEVVVGDRFTLTTFGEVLSYEVIDKKVVDPADTASLRQEAGKDLVTLVTCTPLGINSHRILVTATRVTPTPAKDVTAGTSTPAGPAFAWWGVWYLGSIVALVLYIVWSTRRTPALLPVRKEKKRRKSRDTEMRQEVSEE